MVLLKEIFLILFLNPSAEAEISTVFKEEVRLVLVVTSSPPRPVRSALDESRPAAPPIKRELVNTATPAW